MKRQPPQHTTRPTQSADEFRQYRADIKSTEPRRYQRHRRKKRLVPYTEVIAVPDLYKSDEAD